jgi:hypothetical protein
MTVYSVRAFHTAVGGIQFFFTKDPSVSDILKRWDEWVGDAEQYPAHKQLKEELLTSKSFKIEVVEN